MGLVIQIYILNDYITSIIVNVLLKVLRQGPGPESLVAIYVIRKLAKQHSLTSQTQVGLCHTQKKGMSFRTPQFLTTTKLLISQVYLIASTIVVDTLK